MKWFICLLFFHLTLLTFSIVHASGQKNIILILIDDLGWSDLACYGGDLHETANIDALASEGLRFTEAYAAAPVCSPSRAALLSGEHPARLHMTTWREAAKVPPKDKKLIPPVTREDLPLETVTLAERLKEAGYKTIHIGKWHLGDAGHYAQTQGFDIGIGGTHWGCPTTYFYPFKGMSHGDFRYVPGIETGQKGDYLPDQLTGKAVELINSAAGQPFFLYMAYYTVHTPIEAKEADIGYFENRIKPAMQHSNTTYAAMVKNMDENVGRILRSLEKNGIKEKSIVIFSSDNGGVNISWRKFPVVTDNAPLRSGKGSLYEGGIRVPLIIRWPGVTRAGDVCKEPVLLTDLYSTLVASAGLAPTVGWSREDSRNLLPILKNPASALNRSALYWHFPHYYPTTTPVSAIRKGKWKLLEFLEDNHLELYDLEQNLSEDRNLIDQFPDQAADLAGDLAFWRVRINAQMPEPAR